MGQRLPLKIGVIGAGFSGAAAVAALHETVDFPLEIILCDKSGCFGAGDAYRSPFPFHLLNARARDMSALETKPEHFVAWLKTSLQAKKYLDHTQPIGDQFVPRLLYGEYLNELLQTIAARPSHVSLQFEHAEVIDILPKQHGTLLLFSDQRQVIVDKVILALGNGAPLSFSFPITAETRCITNPWDYTAPQQIAKDDPVLIVGTGLSMIDAVLTLTHQHHTGKIYAVSRHGLLPLPHADLKVPFFSMREHLPHSLRLLTKYVRTQSQCHIEAGGDWRSVINAVRTYVPSLWAEASVVEKKRFLRHLLPYWNIHRHRVHAKVAELLNHLAAEQQLTVMSGRLLAVEAERAHIQLRHTHERVALNIKWLINCMGPPLTINAAHQPLVQALIKRGMATLDTLNLGFDTSAVGELKIQSGESSSRFYLLGPYRKGAALETVAVPEIRQQCDLLAKHIVSTHAVETVS